MCDCKILLQIGEGGGAELTEARSLPGIKEYFFPTSQITFKQFIFLQKKPATLSNTFVIIPTESRVGCHMRVKPWLAT